MDPSGYIDDETIIKRLIYKEKPDMRSLAQKCIELEKIDYSKVHASERDENIRTLHEELNSLEHMTEKQAVLHEMFVSEQDFHKKKQEELKKDIENCAREIEELKEELVQEKNFRANLLEYEAYAKNINTLPRCEETMELIEKVDEQHAEVCKIMEMKNEKLREVEMRCKNIVENIKDMIKEVEESVGSF